MTRTPTPNPAKFQTPEQPQPQQQPQPTEPPADEWATLPAPVAMPDKKVSPDIRPDVLATVPDAIRARIEDSLAKSCKAVAAKANSTAKRARINYDWQLQPLASIEQGNKFCKLAIKYGKYRPTNTTIPHRQDGTPDGQITVRCGTPGIFRLVHDEYVAVTGDKRDTDIYAVRFSARPFEARKDTTRVTATP